MSEILKKFTTRSKAALKKAGKLAADLRHKFIEPEHLLYALSQEKGSIASEILTKFKIFPERIILLVEKNPVQTDQNSKPRLSEEIKLSIRKAVLRANLNSHKYIGSEHLLAGILDAKPKILMEFLKKQNIDLDALYSQISSVLKSTSKFPDLTDSLQFYKEKDPSDFEEPGRFTFSRKPGFSLELFATELTDPDLQKQIDPVIERETEIERLIQILSRRTKNNPMLIGDPGVGKTAIVEGLAKKIVLGEVPDILQNKKIYSLDMALLVAGTSFRGEFENRLKNVLQEIKKNQNIILFIDEIHNIVGAGSATGSMDAANILKPSLSRGEIRCIGATTLEDYKKHIETDPALDRRFQSIFIEQPTPEKTINILRGLRENYQNFHQVRISDEAITTAVNFSSRYIHEKFFPDKAIDLIDEASAAVKINKVTNGAMKEVKQLEKNLFDTIVKKQKAVACENFTEAIKRKNEEKKINEKIFQLKEKYAKSAKKYLAEVKKEDIIKITSSITKLPLEQLLAAEKNRLLNLEKILSEKIIGQENALKIISDFIRRTKSGIASADRPLVSFMFLGPTGVGKTMTAKILAETIFGSADNFIRIDMSEFQESFNISKLIGAPAGYVGYKDTTKLTDEVRKKPYSVILFDEIEKAHPDVFNLLLQVLEDGHLTDAGGRKAHFKNSIIIMTSNIGSEKLLQEQELGFGGQRKNAEKKHDFARLEDKIFKELKEFFRPEFLNRIDKLIVFNPLSFNSIIKIVKCQIDELNERLQEKGYYMQYDNELIKFLAKKSCSRQDGARAVRKIILEFVENRLAEEILSDKMKKKIKVRAEKNKVVFK